MHEARGLMAGALLLGADYYGTLAAARAYGKAGVPVTMADGSRRGRALFSRFVGEKLVHPAEPAALVEWLVDFGAKHPGTFLYPTNDHLAWLFAAERERLSRKFDMFSPAEDTIITLLDKQRMHDACAAVGIDVPDTRVAKEGGEYPYPVLLKPRTQVYLLGGIKGFIARDAGELAAELARFRELVRFHPMLMARHPEVAEPMVQQYLTAAETNIFSVSGFVSADGDIVARGAIKVLQRPRKVGIGLCFESVPVEPRLVEQIAALCKHVGYHGAFESEFIADGDARLLIDFNPRFYSQMGFDIARGLPLPLLVWHSARGENAEVKRLMAEAKAWSPTGEEVYLHKTMLDLVLGLQGLSGQMSRDDVKKWRSWYAEHRRTATDAVRDAADPRPAMIDALMWAKHFAKHPRSFVRDFILNR